MNKMQRQKIALFVHLGNIDTFPILLPCTDSAFILEK